MRTRSWRRRCASSRSRRSTPSFRAARSTASSARSPKAQLKQFIQKLAKLGAGEAGPSPIDEALEHAEAALKEGDHEAASRDLRADPGARAGQFRRRSAAWCAADRGRASWTRPSISSSQVPAAQANNPAIAGARGADRIGGSGPEGGRPSRRSCAPGSMPTRGFRGALRPGARFCSPAATARAALDQLLEIILAPPRRNEEAARKELVKFFEAMGPTDPLTLSARRRLSSILFS